MIVSPAAIVAFVIIVLVIAAVIFKLSVDGDRLPPAKQHARDVNIAISVSGGTVITVVVASLGPLFVF